MKNIYLVGMPGCGKSTIGNAVSKKIGIEIIDLDELVMEREGKSIEELFAIGEAHFRAVEAEALKSLENYEGVMVATGGGVVTKEENIEFMKKDGKVIFIDASPNFILENSPLDGRPLLKNKEKIYELYNSRIAKYRKSADYTVPNDGILSDAIKKTEELIRIIIKKGAYNET